MRRPRSGNSTHAAIARLEASVGLLAVAGMDKAESVGFLVLSRFRRRAATTATTTSNSSDQRTVVDNGDRGVIEREGVDGRLGSSESTVTKDDLVCSCGHGSKAGLLEGGVAGVAREGVQEDHLNEGGEIRDERQQMIRKF